MPMSIVCSWILKYSNLAFCHDKKWKSLFVPPNQCSCQFSSNIYYLVNNNHECLCFCAYCYKKFGVAYTLTHTFYFFACSSMGVKIYVKIFVRLLMLAKSSLEIIILLDICVTTNTLHHATTLTVWHHWYPAVCKLSIWGLCDVTNQWTLPLQEEGVEVKK